MSDWKRVRAIVEAALELEGQARERFLDARCEGQEDLRQEVLSYLAEDLAPDTYLDTPPDPNVLREALARADPELPAGTRVGPWIVQTKLASGGMGTVYRAQRADGSFEKTVAIKLIKAGMDSLEVLARFENERRVLAELEHAGVARLLDAGTTEGGRPYIVMEYVEGRPIDVHARESSLGLRQRLELFAAVCDAVHAAHRLLVVHRDLKPDNILVTPSGAPKLLDFGIAKVLQPDERDTQGRDATLGPSRVMTPEYASPEQIRGEAIGTASDVYSLGVVLYELLAGKRPLHFAGLGRAEVEKIASLRQPAPPSSAADEGWARSAGTDARSLKSRLAGDLDTIVLKALRKEPERRYASASLLAEDLRRHLAGQPVLARPATWTYRVSRLVHRNRPAALATSLAVLALASGLIASQMARTRAGDATELAEQRFDDVHELARRFLFEFDTLLENVDDATPARESVVQTGLQHLSVLSRQATNDMSLTREMALAYIKLGDLQGGALVSNLGQREAAMQSYQKALDYAGRLPSGEPESNGVLALCLHRIGALEESMGALENALDHYQRALSLGAFHSERLTSSELFHALAEVQDGLIELSLRSGDQEGALRHAEEFARLADEGPSHGNDEFRPQRQNLSLVRLGNTLAMLGQPREAEPKLRDAVERARDMFLERPNDAFRGRHLGFCLTSLVKLLQTRGQQEECLSLIEESTEVLRELYARDPKNTQAARDLGISLQFAASIYSMLDDSTASLDASLEYLAITERLVAIDPDNFRYISDLIGARLALCRSRAMRGEFESALDEGQAAERQATQLSALQPLDVHATRGLAVVASELGMLRRGWSRSLSDPTRKREELELASTAFTRGLEVLTQLRDEGRLAPGDERYIERARQDVESCRVSIAELGTASAAGANQ